MSIPPQLIQQLKVQEGVLTSTYADSLGNLTIGVGHTPAYAGEVWTMAQVDAQLESDLERFLSELDADFPWAVQMGVVRHAVFWNMTFNLGMGHFEQFHETINDAKLAIAHAAAEKADYDACAAAMLYSLWARQVGQRAVDLAKQMRTGEWVL
jgi:lysozyme